MAHEATTDRRSEILAAALKVFEASGYAATTVEAIAEAAGIAKGSIYNYFSSKHDLFQQIFTDAMAAAEAEATPILAEAIPAAEKITKVLDYWFSRLGYYRQIGRLVLEFWVAAAREQQGELARTLANSYAQWRQRLADVLTEGIQEGAFRQDVQSKVGASMIMAVLDGIEVQLILGVYQSVDQEFLTALKRAILTALSEGRQGGGGERRAR
jgi:AcrR family transcriptional regulator